MELWGIEPQTSRVRLYGIEVDPAMMESFEWGLPQRAVLSDMAWRHMMRNSVVQTVLVYATPDQRDGEPFGFLQLIGQATVADVVQLLGMESARDITIYPWSPPPRTPKVRRLDQWTISTGNAIARGVDREISVRRALADKLEAAGARRGT